MHRTKILLGIINNGVTLTPGLLAGGCTIYQVRGRANDFHGITTL